MEQSWTDTDTGSAQKNGLDFETVEANVKTKDEALKWMIDNQLGRRNITNEQRTYLLGLRYRQEKKCGAPEGNTSHQILIMISNRYRKATQRGGSRVGYADPTVLKADRKSNRTAGKPSVPGRYYC